ncbi:MAG: type II toxin-antitoxin system VapC family toxin [Armatimonadetes bacterium]|nr:type II toxin-antitoxin system VapC family toxin [Armatimonadota bacterium]MDW8027224.1 type II toxin-antitoxin system VapC family toxin [Armatimonadota bacterium]
MRLVLNASVVIKWLLADEPLVPEARRLLQEFQEGRWKEFIVPEFCLREVANALWVAYRRGRITEEEARIGWQSFLQLDLNILPDPPLGDVLDFSLRHNLPVYDSIYILLAQQENCPLLTADEKLFQTVADQLPFLQWLGDYGQ